MNRYTKYIAAAVVLLVLVAVIACEQEAAPSTGTAAPAAVATTQPADGATPSTSAGATTGTTSPTAQVATTQPAEATAAPTGSEATSGSNQGGSRLETVRNRGHVVCASRNDVPGYGSLDDSGNNVGFDIDLCRALAAAVLGDPNAIEIRLITAAERGPTIQSGEVDMLVRTVTWTSSRDAQWGNYAQTMFYDGQGFLISKDLGITSALELRDATVCVTQGTTTELNLQDFSNQNDLDIAPLTFEDTDAVVAAYESGQCDAFTNDRSQLAAFRSAFADRDAHVILPETISEEPLGPVVPHGDDQWFDIVKTTMAILIYAEAYGVTSATVPASATGATAVDRMLGFDGSFGQETLGLSQTVAQDVISAVGNYGEIYDRNLGPGNVNLPRENGRNALWADAPCTDCPKGGQIYAAPLR
jgi:general L-amino acid transport system substrate-binding protein